MLDNRTAAVLSVINEICGDGTYKVIESDEIIAKLPLRLSTEAEGLKQTIKYLRDREYIDIKYSDDNVYCLYPQPKGRLYFEREKADRQDSREKFRKFLVTAFWGAFAGAIIGSIITAILTTFVLR